jgi:uncharacterized protein (DUF433 family)
VGNGYVEKRDNTYRIVGSRVSLESVVYAFRDGLSAETIAIECFPTLTLEKVYGAIAFYLAHRKEIDEHLALTENEDRVLRKSLNEPSTRDSG